MSYILKGGIYLFYLPINEFIGGDGASSLKYLPDNSIDLLFTDPPYNISCSTKLFKDYRGNGNRTQTILSFDFGHWDYGFDPLLFLNESIRVLHPTGSWIIWTSEQLYGTYRQWAIDAGMHFKQTLIYRRTNALPQFRKIGYRQATELMCWISKKPIGKNNPNFIFQSQEEMTNVFDAPICGGKERTAHPTQKPLSICQKIIKTHCRPRGVVLDLFSGSGTIALAAYSTGRNFIAVEQEEKWNKIAEKRIREYQVVKEEKTDKFEQLRF